MEPLASTERESHYKPLGLGANPGYLLQVTPFEKTYLLACKEDLVSLCTQLEDISDPMA